MTSLTSSKVSLWRRLSHRDIDHRCRSEEPAPSRRAHLPVGKLRQQVSLDGFVLCRAALEAQAKPRQRVGRRWPCRGTTAAGLYQHGRWELPRTARYHDVDGRDKPSLRCAPNQSDFGAGAAAGSAAACGARPTMTVRRPWPHSRLAAALASSRVTASTMVLRFSI